MRDEREGRGVMYLCDAFDVLDVCAEEAGLLGVVVVVVVVVLGGRHDESVEVRV